MYSNVSNKNIIEIDGFNLHTLKLVRIIHKKLHHSSLQYFDYVDQNQLLQPKFSLFYNLVGDTTYCQAEDLDRFLHMLSLPLQEQIKEYLSFLPPLNKCYSILSTREHIYYLLIKLLIKNAPIVIVDKMDFGNEFHSLNLFMHILKNYKIEKQIYIRKQDNILSTLSQKSIIYIDGQLKNKPPSNNQLSTAKQQQIQEIPAIVPTNKKVA